MPRLHNGQIRFRIRIYFLRVDTPNVNPNPEIKNQLPTFMVAFNLEGISESGVNVSYRHIICEDHTTGAIHSTNQSVYRAWVPFGLVSYHTLCFV